MTRRSPRWMVEAVAWVGALTLLAGVGTVVSGVINKTTVYGETPVVSIAPVATAAPVLPKPVRHVKVVVHSRASGSSVPVVASLGPPPGPVNDLAPTAYAPPEQRYAFLYGITKYHAPTEDTIAGAQDNIYIRSFLLASGWLPQNIRLVTDDAATGDALRSGLAWLASKSTPGTFTLFHYSGHVKQRNGHEYLWPNDSDRDFVSNTEVATALNRGTGRMWVDIAGCESGGFIDGLASDRVLVSSSSEVHEKSYEYPQWGESVFAGLVWDLGLGQGQADANHNGVTTVGEALRYAQYYAHAITLNQQPYGPQIPQFAGYNRLGWTLADPPA